MESILITARIRKGRYDAVRSILAEGPPFDLPLAGIDRHCVFVSPGTVSFLFEGPPGLHRVVRGLAFSRAVMSQMLRIGSHVEGMPHEMETAFEWCREAAAGAPATSVLEAEVDERAVG